MFLLWLYQNSSWTHCFSPVLNHHPQAANPGPLLRPPNPRHPFLPGSWCHSSDSCWVSFWILLRSRSIHIPPDQKNENAWSDAACSYFSFPSQWIIYAVKRVNVLFVMFKLYQSKIYVSTVFSFMAKEFFSTNYIRSCNCLDAKNPYKSTFPVVLPYRFQNRM